MAYSTTAMKMIIHNPTIKNINNSLICPAACERTNLSILTHLETIFITETSTSRSGGNEKESKMREQEKLNTLLNLV